LPLTEFRPKNLSDKQAIDLIKSSNKNNMFNNKQKQEYKINN